MIRNVCLSLLLSLIFVSNTFSQNIFELKGKNIILTSEKIAFGWKNSHHDDFGKIYNINSLKKHKFTKNNLYKGDILGKTAFVNDVYVINPNNKKKKAILMVLNIDTDAIIVYMPLYLKTEAYIGGFRVDVEVNPEEINLCYHDCDKINQLQNRMQNKCFYLKGRNELYTFDDINIENDLLSIQYYDNTFKKHKYHIRANNTANQATYGDFDTFTSSIVFADDLITQCKQKHDSVQIQVLIDSFLNKEIYLQSGSNRGFYICENIGIENIGTHEPCYDYVLTLRQEENIIKLPIQNDMSHIVLADAYREEQRIQEEKQQKEEAEYQAMLEKEEREYKATLIKKYGKRNALLILENAVKIGFTKEMCVESWGEPYDINRTVTRNCIHEQWVYGIGRYLYFEGNILTAIQD